MSSKKESILDKVEENEPAETEEAPVAEESAVETEAVEEERVPLAALTDERKKRQEYEARARDLELRVAQMEGATRAVAALHRPEPQKEEVPTFEFDYADIPGSFNGLPANIEKLVQYHLSKAEKRYEETRQARSKLRLETSIEHAREDHSDYDEVVAEWDRAYAAAVAIGQRTGDFSEQRKMDSSIGAASNPAEFAYRWSKKRRAQAGVSSEAAALKKEIAELKRRLGEESESASEEGSDEAAPKEEKKQSPRPSLAGSSGRPPNTKNKKSGGSILDDALSGR